MNDKNRSAIDESIEQITKIKDQIATEMWANDPYGRTRRSFMDGLTASITVLTSIKNRGDDA